MAKNTRHLLSVLMPLVSLGLFALVFEVGVLLAVGEQPKFPRHVVGAEFGVRVNEPDAHYRHKSPDGTWWFEINSRGLRDTREFAYEKPPGVKRIVSLGDSFTAGYEVDADQTFSSILERTLREAGHDVEVLNAGVSGYSNAEALVYLERELLRYDPDVVLISFFANDLVDNLRTGLFALDAGGDLEQLQDAYVPAGFLGNFLNTNPVFNWLSGYSNSFVFTKERVTHIVKRQLVAQNLANVADATDEAPLAAQAPQAVDDDATPEQTLAVAIFDRLYEMTRARGIPFVIQSIPIPVGETDGELIEVFPLDHFDLDREGLHFVSMQQTLSKLASRERLYHRKSHGHWTPASHLASGQAIAGVVLGESLLENSLAERSP